MKEKGQITLLAVIIGVLGLTLGLSVASRSLSDLRQATTVDVGTKALAAAEAGAEYGLNKLATNPNYSGDTLTGMGGLSFSGVNNLTVGVTKDNTGYALKEGVPKDDVYQVDLSTPSTFTGPFQIWWTKAPGVSVSVLYANSYVVNRYAYRGNPAGVASSFDTASGCSSTSCDGGKFSSQAGGTNCASGPLSTQGGNGALLVRVRPVGDSANILVCPTTGTLPSQYYEVTAKATTTNGTVKRVRVRRDISGTLPAVFDNVLYSGGSIVKD